MAFVISRGRKTALGIAKKQLDAPGNGDHFKWNVWMKKYTLPPKQQSQHRRRI
jgi:hypothetical protein